MAYFVIAFALYMDSSCRGVLRCLLEGLQWLRGSLIAIEQTGQCGISRTRTRLGDEVARRVDGETVKAIAMLNGIAVRGRFSFWRVDRVIVGWAMLALAGCSSIADSG